MKVNSAEEQQCQGLGVLVKQGLPAPPKQFYFWMENKEM